MEESKKIYITSLDQLKEWNNSPTKEKPYVIDWFFDWVIDECSKNYTEFKDAMDVFHNFTQICEELDSYKAFERVRINLKFWYSRHSKNNKLFKEHFNKYLLTSLGFG